MVTLNVSLPETLNAWVMAKVEAGEYADANDYLLNLIRNDQLERSMRENGVSEDIEAIAAALEEGEKSGKSPYTADEILERVLARKKRD